MPDASTTKKPNSSQPADTAQTMPQTSSSSYTVATREMDSTIGYEELSNVAATTTPTTNEPTTIPTPDNDPYRHLDPSLITSHETLLSSHDHQPKNFWHQQALKICWLTPPLASTSGRNFYPDGIINACHSTIDVMVEQGYGDRVAFVFDDTDGYFYQGEDKELINNKELKLNEELNNKELNSGNITEALHNHTDINTHNNKINADPIDDNKINAESSLHNYLHSHSTRHILPTLSHNLSTHIYTYTQSLLIINQLSQIILKILKERMELPEWYDETIRMDQKSLEEMVKEVNRGLERKCRQYQQQMSNTSFSSKVDSSSTNQGTSTACTNLDHPLNSVTVTIYMPMSPYTIFSALACARLGITHNVIFGGYSIQSVIDRLKDCQSPMLISCMSSVRGKNRMDFFNRVKEIPVRDILIVDDDLEYIQRVIRTSNNNSTNQSRTSNNNSTFTSTRTTTSLLTPNNHIHFFPLFPVSPFYTVPRPVLSTHPLFILYTSGSTGRPKGLVHGTGGYLVYVKYTMEQVFGYQSSLRTNEVDTPNQSKGDISRTNQGNNTSSFNQGNTFSTYPGSKQDRTINPLRLTTPFFCTADLGWITGHSYTLYGPLLSRITSIVLMGLPTSPFSDRLLAMIQGYGVRIFYTAPTLVRCLKKLGVTNNLELGSSLTDNSKVISSEKNNLISSEKNNLITSTNGQKYTFPHLQIVASVGEPLNLPAYLYYSSLFTRPIIDTYFQTETGGIICYNKVGVDGQWGESCGRSIVGIGVCVVERVNGENSSTENSKLISSTENSKLISSEDQIFSTSPIPLKIIPKPPKELGLIIFVGGWPGMALTILGDNERFEREYLAGGVYWTGDEGYWRWGYRGAKVISSTENSKVNSSSKRISSEQISSTENSNLFSSISSKGISSTDSPNNQELNITLTPAPYFYIRGRVDDVLNISGHRISTAEVESATNAHRWINECAMVGRANELTGMGIVLFVVADIVEIIREMELEKKNKLVPVQVQPGVVPPQVVQEKSNLVQPEVVPVQENGNLIDPTSIYGDRQSHTVLTTHLSRKIKLHLRQHIGTLIHPDRLFLVPDIPKTRTGKLMRRVLKQILVGEELGDLSTMGNGECLAVIKQIVSWQE